MFQRPPGKGLDGAILYRLPRFDDKVKEAAGNLPLAQFRLDAQGTPLVMIGRMTPAGGIPAGTKMLHKTLLLRKNPRPTGRG